VHRHGRLWSACEFSHVGNESSAVVVFFISDLLAEIGDAARRNKGHCDQARRVGGLAVVEALAAAVATTELTARQPARHVALQ
jgi:hypothetical protein